MTQTPVRRRRISQRPDGRAISATIPESMPDLDEVRARHQNASMAGEYLHHVTRGLSNLPPDAKSAIGTLTRSWQDVSALHDSLRILAVDILTRTASLGLPAAYWPTEPEVVRACAVLELEPAEAARMNWKG